MICPLKGGIEIVLRPNEFTCLEVIERLFNLYQPADLSATCVALELSESFPSKTAFFNTCDTESVANQLKRIKMSRKDELSDCQGNYAGHSTYSDFSRVCLFSKASSESFGQTT